MTLSTELVRCLKKVRELNLRATTARRISDKFAAAGAYTAADQWTAEAARLDFVVEMVKANARQLGGCA